MLRSLLVFVALALAWVLLLWFALPFQITAQSNGAILLAHSGPPLLLWGGWLLIRTLQKRRKVQALAQEQAAAEADRQKALAEFQERQAAELARLRFGCDCRGAVIAGLCLSSEVLEAAQPPCDSSSLDDQAGDEADEEAEEDFVFQAPKLSADMSAFAGPLKQALEAIYRSAPAAMALPVFSLPPAHIVAGEAFELIRSLAMEIAEELERDEATRAADVQIRFAPSGDSPSESAIRVFDDQPDLPGALILAFDAPAQRDDAAFAKLLSSEQRAALEAKIAERSNWLGEPRAAVVALLLTHPDIDAMLASISGYAWEERDSDDAMIPFWQRGGEPTGVLAALARFAPDDREALRHLPRLARVHRPAVGKLNPQARVMEACVAHQNLLEKALVAGGLPRGDQTSDASEQQSGAPSDEPAKASQPLGWLLHNAGTLARYGPRLGALATAVSHFGFDLHPLDEATNFAQQVGDLGGATPWAMLAEAATRASTLDTPALVSHYEQGDMLALSLAMPLDKTEAALA